MAISIDPATRVITIPQADLTFISGDLYELDTDQFRKDVNDLLSSEPYAWMPDAYQHNPEYTIVGVTYARSIEFINGYSVTFENNTYTVRLAGSNNNIFDVENGILNPSGNVTVVGQNSAGLIVVTSGSGLSAAQDTRVTEIHQDRGLESGTVKTITENTEGESYDEDVGVITKEVRKSGDTTTIERT
jgi:hypothetical protein